MAKLIIPEYVKEMISGSFVIKVIESAISPTVTVVIKVYGDEDDKLKDQDIYDVAHWLDDTNTKNFVLVSTSVSFITIGEPPITIGICTFIEKSLFNVPKWNGVCGSM